MSIRVATNSNNSVILGSTPTVFSNRTPYTINEGHPVPCYLNNGNISFNSNLTYTTASKVTQTKNFSDILISDYSDGTYKIVLPAEGNQPYLISNHVITSNKYPYTDCSHIGTLTLKGNIISGFTNNDYLLSKDIFNPGSNKWKMKICLTTGSNYAAANCIIGNGGTNERI